MSRNHLLTDIKEFLKSLNLSNYEIRAYLILLQSNIITAREISKIARIPIGRIYDVLEDLKEKGMIEIQETRPKVYKAVSPNISFHNLITHIKSENQRKIYSMFDQAKLLESKINKSKLWIKQESSGIFWSSALGTNSVLSLYIKKIDELQEELLMTGFLNERSIKVMPYGRNLFMSIKNAIDRGIQLKYLWSFQYDKRPLSDDQKLKNSILHDKLLKKLKELYGFSQKKDSLEIKFIQRNFPTYYDILDKNRVLIKLQNPIKPSQFFSCLNVLDPSLANELRKKFLETWVFEAVE